MHKDIERYTLDCHHVCWMRELHILNMSLAFRFMDGMECREEEVKVEENRTKRVALGFGYFSISLGWFEHSALPSNNKSKHIKCDAHLDMLSVINASAFRIYYGNWNFLHWPVENGNICPMMNMLWTSCCWPSNQEVFTSVFFFKSSLFKKRYDTLSLVVRDALNSQHKFKSDNRFLMQHYFFVTWKVFEMEKK